MFSLIMAWNSRSKWTRSKLEPPRLPTRLTEFQDADLSDTYVPIKDASTSVQALEGRVPNYLLLVSLLEHLCSLYETDPEKSKKIFNVICQQLVKMKVMPPFSFIEEFSVIRAKYKTVFSDLMQAAAKTTGTDLLSIPSGLRKPALSTYNRCICRSLSAPQKMKDLLQNGTSRYKEEFVEIIRLGKGGFGSVFKVKNKLDGREYAVKKVPLKETNPDLCLKVLREVKVLANLSHSNVVGYHAAWLEYVTTDTVSTAMPRVATVPTSLQELSDLSSLNGIHRIMEVSQDSQNSIVFESSSQDPSNSGIVFMADNNSVGTGNQAEGKLRGTHAEGRLGKIHSTNLRSTNSTRNSRAPYHASRRSMRRSASSSSLGSMAGKDDYRIDDEQSSELSSDQGSALTESILKSTAVNKRLGMVLFIQMQLCTTTLRDWLVKRNEDISHAIDGQVDKSAVAEIFRQVVEGVSYIHSQALLHRDLKPRNIFLQGLRHPKEERHSFQVKIGDFGLARKEMVVSPGASSPLASLIEPPTPLFPLGYSGKDAPTAGVGTCTYASPEQLRNNIYDNKADIYSLGIILFELYCHFGTEMERVKSIKELRQGRLPEDFCKKWPEESKLILEMIAENSSNRPTAESLLELGFLKAEHTQLSDRLREKVKEQASEMIELRKMLLQKDEELDARTDEVSELRRQLEEKDKLIEQVLANKQLCTTCSRKLVNQVEEMDTR